MEPACCSDNNGGKPVALVEVQTAVQKKAPEPVKESPLKEAYQSPKPLAFAMSRSSAPVSYGWNSVTSLEHENRKLKRQVRHVLAENEALRHQAQRALAEKEEAQRDKEEMERKVQHMMTILRRARFRGGA